MSPSIETGAPAPLLDTVRTTDRDRYIATLYAPEGKREDLLALYAFNAEIAGIRDRVSQALPGEIRIQWWRDIIEDGSMDAAAGHPVASALLTAIERNALPVHAFQNYLDARIFDLYDDPMPSRGDLEGYCGETAAAIIQLSALVLDAGTAAGVSRLAGHAGCAIAICGLLRLLPLHRSRGQCYVPTDILAAAGSTADEFVAGDGGQNAPRVVAAMIALAREHLSAFEREAATLPQALRPAFLAVAPVGAQLSKMHGREKDVLTTGMDIAAWRKQWLMFRRASKGWS